MQKIFADKKLRIGIVGLGRVATSTHIPVLNLLDDVEITACAETNVDRVHRAREIIDLPNVYNDYHDMFMSRLVDAVYICVPPHFHFDAAISALENGIHVFCEKPMGRNLQEATKIDACAKAKNLILMPGFKYRYNKNLQRAAKMISSGLLGSVLQVEATFMTPGPYISWDPKSDWYLDREQGGALYDIGVHIIELTNMLVPVKITKIYANATQGYYEYETPTNVSCSFITENEIVGTMIFGWRSAVDLIKVSIYGTAGAILVDLKSFYYYNAGTDPKDRIFNHLKNTIFEFESAIGRIISLVKGSDVSVTDFEQAKAFVAAIKTQSSPPVSGENAVYVHRVLESIQRSIDSNGPIVI